MTGDSWRDADPAVVTEAVYYALRFGQTGTANGKRAATDDGVMARAVVEHLLWANYWILRRPPRAPHGTVNLLAATPPRWQAEGCGAAEVTRRSQFH